jgi:hypothetical protein
VSGNTISFDFGAGPCSGNASNGVISGTCQSGCDFEMTGLTITSGGGSGGEGNAGGAPPGSGGGGDFYVAHECEVDSDCGPGFQCDDGHFCVQASGT